MVRDSFRLRLDRGPETRQVVVKFKNTPASRTGFRLIAAADREARRAFRESPLDTIEKMKGLERMEPLFPQQAHGRAAMGDRLVASVPTAVDEEMASFNVLRFQDPEKALAAVSALTGHAQVEYAHVIPPRYLMAAPRRRVSARRRSNDPMLGRQWGLTAVALQQAQSTAGFKEATTIPIAVIDSGVDANHPDLRGVIADEQNFTPGPVRDTQGHGTHVSGIIAAVRNNRVGVTGLCQSKQLLSLKALGPYDGPGYYRAIQYATDRAKVINLSLGGGHDPTEETLIKRAIARGVVVVAAMGNDFETGNPTSYPAAITGVIAVGATNEVDQRTAFSQTGRHIKLVAPGLNILSTVPTYPSSLANGVDYEAWPGTSMATPFVAATVALMIAKRPSASLAAIAAALQRGTDRVAGQNGFNREYGHGRLNVRKTLAAI